MLTITKNGKTKKVSESVFKTVFKDSGWSVVGEQSPTSAVSDENVETEKVEIEENVNEVVEENKDDSDDEIPDEEWDEAIAEEEVEKPLSEMNREEMLAKAKNLGINADGMNNKQLREAIKKKM